jgi:alpha-glucoside transport system permease protein
MPEPPRRFGSEKLTLALFILPALALLGALVVYPILFSVVRSLYDANGDTFVGLRNYQEMFTSGRTLHALQNNAVWVVFAPTLATFLGLIFAVLAERVRWSTAFKIIVFVPMAISLVAAGIIFRLVFEESPERGLANGGLAVVRSLFEPQGAYPGAAPSGDQFTPAPAGGFTSKPTFSPGDVAVLGLVRIPANAIAEDAPKAAEPQAQPGAIAGTVYLDFTRGGGGETGVIDETEVGLPGVGVEAVADGEVVASATSSDDGTFVLDGLEDGSTYAVRMTKGAFSAAWGGVTWLGPTLVTPSIIVAWLWIWAGFAMVVIGAGLASISRETLEAARVDGGSEWQVFRHITVPLLAPVLLVVLVTLVINVLKIFDLVLIMAPGSVQDSANVVALEMYRVSFGGARNQGLGSALAILLFLLVLPAMAFNVRRFLEEQ